MKANSPYQDYEILSLTVPLPHSQQVEPDHFLELRRCQIKMKCWLAGLRLVDKKNTSVT